MLYSDYKEKRCCSAVREMNTVLPLLSAFPAELQQHILTVRAAAIRKVRCPMKYVIIGRNMEVTSTLDQAIRDKLGKLERYFSDDTVMNVTLSVDRDRHNVEVTIPVKGGIVRCEQASSDMYVSIDLAQEILERQIRKYRTRVVNRERSQENSFKREFVDADYIDDEEVRIVRKKQFDMKPMYPEDACVQMELLGHTFYVFRNAETEQINVVYKRKGGTYGLIEPEE